jgi:Family of unknown function (DUF5701)
MPNEFDRQVKNLIGKNYPSAAGISKAKFLKLLEPLRKAADSISRVSLDVDNGRLPFVIVIKSELVPATKTMPLVKRQGRRGIVAMQPVTPDQFSTIDRVKIPEGPVYLLVDIDRGRETLNVRPEDAMKIIRRKKRSPLTIDEGIAIVTQFPDFLMKNNCFSLLASRRADQRVPAIWIDGKKSPKLGWCWDRNPHTWLGSASCKRRINI